MQGSIPGPAGSESDAFTTPPSRSSSEASRKIIYTYKSSLQIHILKEFGQIGRLCTTI